MSLQATPPTVTARRRNESQLLTDVKYRWPARYRASGAALLIVVLGAAVLTPSALSGASTTLVTALAGVLAITAFGQLLIIMTGAIDLSASAIVSLAAGVVVHHGVKLAIAAYATLDRARARSLRKA